MANSYSVIESEDDDDASPSSVPSEVDVPDRDPDDTKNQLCLPRTSIPIIMTNSYSAIESSAPNEDEILLLHQFLRGVDVLDRDPDDLSTTVQLSLIAALNVQVGVESCHSMMGYDELCEILSWMSAKSAIKYSSSLCTWLRGIHSDPRFIRKQCIRSYGQENGFFLQPMLMRYHCVSKDFEFHLLPWETGSAIGIPRESVDYLPNHGPILSSSNGLLLLGNNPSRTSSSEFMVCNPATREWAPLPTPEGVVVQFNDDVSPLIECYPWANGALDEVEFPNDYTIIMPVQAELECVIRQGALVLQRKQQLLIYSNGKWEEELFDVSIVGWAVRYDSPVAIFSNTTKGLVVHYLCDIDGRHRDNLPDVLPGGPSYSEPYIVAFDIQGKKLLRQIRLPEEAFCGPYIPSYRNLWIFKWNESICLVRWCKNSSAISVWVLDDYGCEGESWRLVASLPEVKLWTVGGHDYVGDWISGVGVASGKGLLIATQPTFPGHPDDEIGSRLFLYMVEGEVGHRRLELVGKHSFGPGTSATFMPYANTLRPVSVRNAETRTY